MNKASDRHKSKGCVRPLSLFYFDASADGVEERSLVPRSRSHAQLGWNATMSHAFSYRSFIRDKRLTTKEKDGSKNIERHRGLTATSSNYYLLCAASSAAFRASRDERIAGLSVCSPSDANWKVKQIISEVDRFMRRTADRRPRQVVVLDVGIALKATVADSPRSALDRRGRLKIENKRKSRGKDSLDPRPVKIFSLYTSPAKHSPMTRAETEDLFIRRARGESPPGPLPPNPSSKFAPTSVEGLRPKALHAGQVRTGSSGSKLVLTLACSSSSKATLSTERSSLWIF
ncbi:hypothetical protein EVAR_4636_1 [Eumeta japonica]|uniref:Uncharacterized protein n=1 Tax=Eumeta variegata TaxID=151549 RepID=A0A4C1SZ15_EUMVA|nr:hypothetical protein EVAR_4636_1 [Eumeta japonica]